MTDPEEAILDRPALRHWQRDRLRALFAEILPRNRFYAHKLAAAGSLFPELESLDDLARLPLTTKVALEPTETLVRKSCEREACVRQAMESHPDIAEARAQVDKAESAVRLAQYQFVPDVDVFARYSWVLAILFAL